MVRVGGGWDTLDHFLLKHDPCRVKGKFIINILRYRILYKAKLWQFTKFIPPINSVD